MAVKIVAIKCSECGAVLEQEEDLIFCPYCGTRFSVYNENEHIYRHINEAKIKQTENDFAIRMRELEIQENKGRERKIKIRIWLGAMAAFMILGIIGSITENDGLENSLFLAFFIGMGGGFYFFMTHEWSEKKETQDIHEMRKIKILPEMLDLADKHYRSVIALFKSAGFQKITAFPNCDLGIFSRHKEGLVIEVAINGNTDYRVGEMYPSNALITITYHSVR